MLVLLLFIVAVALIFAELFLPGMVFGIIGGVMFIASVVLAFRTYGADWGLWISIAEVMIATVIILIGLKRFPQTRAGRILILGRSLDKDLGYSGTDLREEYVGKVGETITHLRPSGMAKIGSERVDVVTEGAFIDKGKKVTVVEVEGNRVVVRELEDAT